MNGLVLSYDNDFASDMRSLQNFIIFVAYIDILYIFLEHGSTMFHKMLDRSFEPQ